MANSVMNHLELIGNCSEIDLKLPWNLTEIKLNCPEIAQTIQLKSNCTKTAMKLL